MSDAQRQTAPRVSFLIATHNRRSVLLHTLDQIAGCGLPRNQFEVLVVDNASTDGAAQAVREHHPDVRLIVLPTNHGPCAKNTALALARGELIVFLDDDSFPQPGSIARMIDHFAANPLLGAAIFTITLPDGSKECSAYPNVCIGCGTGFRRTALLEVGGLPQDFFMAAEEYDLSLRLLDAGWRVSRFDDLHVTHLKSPESRFPRRISRLDARNNLLLALRRFPDPWRFRYAAAWFERYRLMAIANRCRIPFWAGTIEGLARGLAAEHEPINPAAFEQFAKLDQTRLHLQGVSRRLNLRRVLFLDLGKNFLVFQLAAHECGLEIAGIADARLGGRGLRFRGLPILSDAQASVLNYDATIVSNLSPVHAAQRHRQWQQLDPRPVLNLFQPEAYPPTLPAASTPAKAA